MLVPMLKAINAMLEDSQEPKVICARSVITELIAHYKDPNKVARESMEAHDKIMLGDIEKDGELDPEAAAAQEELMP